MKKDGIKKIFEIHTSTILMGLLIGISLIFFSNIGLNSNQTTLYGSIFGAFLGSIIYKDKMKNIEKNWLKVILGLIFDIFIASVIVVAIISLAWFINLI
ncbi:hypothetical protein [Natroniella sp. ANB-PHB2]|uniref:hypothetical protein n=1 Tax=Natroniella sp. ANB-PHB2 TaxID=3384444 RepID=UPI0038D401B5